MLADNKDLNEVEIDQNEGGGELKLVIEDYNNLIKKDTEVLLVKHEYMVGYSVVELYNERYIIPSNIIIVFPTAFYFIGFVSRVT